MLKRSQIWWSKPRSRTSHFFFRAETYLGNGLIWRKTPNKTARRRKYFQSAEAKSRSNIAKKNRILSRTLEVPYWGRFQQRVNKYTSPSPIPTAEKRSPRDVFFWNAHCLSASFREISTMFIIIAYDDPCNRNNSVADEGKVPPFAKFDRVAIGYNNPHIWKCCSMKTPMG